MIAEPFLVIGKAATAFEAVGVRYAIGGSVASSLYGIPRATQDVDVLAEIYGEQVPALAQKLAVDFYADQDAMMQAVMTRASFNLVHLATLFKVDVFVHSREPWQVSELARVQTQSVGVDNDTIILKFASAEDTLLHKLVWYRMGGESSDRQWGDVEGIVKVQGEALDRGYLQHWATELGVADLLAKLIAR